jgi:hypothetical protein
MAMALDEGGESGRVGEVITVEYVESCFGWSDAEGEVSNVVSCLGTSDSVDVWGTVCCCIKRDGPEATVASALGAGRCTCSCIR